MLSQIRNKTYRFFFIYLSDVVVFAIVAYYAVKLTQSIDGRTIQLSVLNMSMCAHITTRHAVDVK